MNRYYFLMGIFLLGLSLSIPVVGAVEVSTPVVSNFGILEQLTYFLTHLFTPSLAIVEATPPFPKTGQVISVAYEESSQCAAFSTGSTEPGLDKCYAGGSLGTWTVCPIKYMKVQIKNLDTGEYIFSQIWTMEQLGITPLTIAVAFKPQSGSWYCEGGPAGFITFNVTGISTTGNYRIYAGTYTINKTMQEVIDSRAGAGYDDVLVIAACSIGSIACWDGKIMQCVGPTAATASWQLKETCQYGCPQNSTTGICNPATGISQSIDGDMCYSNEVNTYKCDVRTANRLNKCLYSSARGKYEWDYQSYCGDGCSVDHCVIAAPICGDGKCEISKNESIRNNAKWCPYDCGGLTDTDCSASPSKYFFAVGAIAINGGEACSCPTGQAVVPPARCALVSVLPVCGDGKCETDKGETVSNCLADCSSQTVCPDGVCNGNETVLSCPSDCTSGQTCEELGYFSSPDPGWSSFDTVESGGLICYVEGGHECKDIVTGECTTQSPPECSGTEEIGNRLVETYDLDSCELIDTINEPCIITGSSACSHGCPEKTCSDWKDDKCVNGVMKESRICTSYTLSGSQCSIIEKIENRVNTAKTCKDDGVSPYVYVLIGVGTIGAVGVIVYIVRKKGKNKRRR